MSICETESLRKSLHGKVFLPANPGTMTEFGGVWNIFSDTLGERALQKLRICSELPSDSTTLTMDVRYTNTSYGKDNPIFN